MNPKLKTDMKSMVEPSPSGVSHLWCEMKSWANASNLFPPNKRSVLLLSFFGEYSDCEIARLLGISNATVSYRKKDALRRLRVMMEAMDHEN